MRLRGCDEHGDQGAQQGQATACQHSWDASVIQGYTAQGRPQDHPTLPWTLQVTGTFHLVRHRMRGSVGPHDEQETAQHQQRGSHGGYGFRIRRSISSAPMISTASSPPFFLLALRRSVVRSLGLARYFITDEAESLGPGC
ncbi:hypothetical protein SAMN00790413_04157 [Deinococcus hopiensis KR-140]|uniref:Uncharacterized protein n=1 Tax=Deinococcus hopiensis KR-140 TaxID=695939 RepID=A0A1W1UQ67_9DEIO|nr:hypothetical protein SAMN00790413_04157 [Deinococcus hopiensis KR-140]